MKPSGLPCPDGFFCWTPVAPSGLPECENPAKPNQICSLLECKNNMDYLTSVSGDCSNKQGKFCCAYTCVTEGAVERKCVTQGRWADRSAYRDLDNFVPESDSTKTCKSTEPVCVRKGGGTTTSPPKVTFQVSIGSLNVIVKQDRTSGLLGYTTTKLTITGGSLTEAIIPLREGSKYEWTFVKSDTPSAGDYVLKFWSEGEVVASIACRVPSGATVGTKVSCGDPTGGIEEPKKPSTSSTILTTTTTTTIPPNATNEPVRITMTLPSCTNVASSCNMQVDAYSKTPYVYIDLEIIKPDSSKADTSNRAEVLPKQGTEFHWKWPGTSKAPMPTNLTGEYFLTFLKDNTVAVSSFECTVTAPNTVTCTEGGSRNCPSQNGFERRCVNSTENEALLKEGWKEDNSLGCALQRTCCPANSPVCVVKLSNATNLCKNEGTTQRKCAPAEASPGTDWTEDTKLACNSANNRTCCPARGLCWVKKGINVSASAAIYAKSLPGKILVNFSGNITNYAGNLEKFLFVVDESEEDGIDGKIVSATGQSQVLKFTGTGGPYEPGTNHSYYAAAVTKDGIFSSPNQTLVIPKGKTATVLTNFTVLLIARTNASNLNLTAEVTGYNGTVARVYLFIDNVSRVQSTTKPYTGIVGPFTTGTNHTYFATAVTPDGNFSSNVSVIEIPVAGAQDAFPVVSCPTDCSTYLSCNCLVSSCPEGTVYVAESATRTLIQKKVQEAKFSFTPLSAGQYNLQALCGGKLSATLQVNVLQTELTLNLTSSSCGTPTKETCTIVLDSKTKVPLDLFILGTSKTGSSAHSSVKRSTTGWTGPRTIVFDDITYDSAGEFTLSLYAYPKDIYLDQPAAFAYFFPLGKV
jgi:hypothetical protein